MTTRIPPEMQPEYGIARPSEPPLRLFHSRYPGRDGDRKNSMVQPVRLLAAVTVCAALLIPARIAFSAQAATAVTGSTTQVASGH